MESDQQIDLEIEKEIEEHKRKNGGRFGHDFFNNLDGFLPGGYRRKWWDKGIISDENLLKEDSRAGPLLKTKTVTEFFQDCDDAVKAAGFTPEDVKRERGLYDSRNSSVSYEAASERFAKFLLPIYKNLRKKGYRRYPDLVA